MQRAGRTHDVRDDIAFVQADAKDLTLLVDSNDTSSQLVLGGGEYGVARDSVHVQALASLQIVQVDETVLRDEVDDSVSLRNLHSHGEVVDGFGGEEDVSCLFLEDWVRSIVIDLHDVKLGDGKNKKE